MEYYTVKRNIGIPRALYSIFAASMIRVITSGHIFAFPAAWVIISLVVINKSFNLSYSGNDL